MKQAHEQKSSYTCKFCNKSYHQQGLLNRHLTSHEKSDKTQCQICLIHFSRVSTMQKHFKIKHENFKPFKCNICEESYSLAFTLKSHIATVHLGLKTFQCQECHQSFGQRGELLSHIKYVHEKLKPFKCLFCDSAFKVNSTLQNHLEGFHGEVMYQCDQCGITYKSEVTFKKHRTEAHNNLKDIKDESNSTTQKEDTILKIKVGGPKHKLEQEKVLTTPEPMETFASIKPFFEEELNSLAKKLKPNEKQNAEERQNQSKIESFTQVQKGKIGNDKQNEKQTLKVRIVARRHKNILVKKKVTSTLDPNIALPNVDAKHVIENCSSQLAIPSIENALVNPGILKEENIELGSPLVETPMDKILSTGMIEGFSEENATVKEEYNLSPILAEGQRNNTEDDSSRPLSIDSQKDIATNARQQMSHKAKSPTIKPAEKKSLTEKAQTLYSDIGLYFTSDKEIQNTHKPSLLSANKSHLVSTSQTGEGNTNHKESFQVERADKSRTPVCYKTQLLLEALDKAIMQSNPKAVVKQLAHKVEQQQPSDSSKHNETSKMRKKDSNVALQSKVANSVLPPSTIQNNELFLNKYTTSQMLLAELEQLIKFG